MQPITQLVQLTEAGAEPLTLAAAKLWLRIDTTNTADDAIITMLCGAARRYAEVFLRRPLLVGDTWQLTLDRFPLWYFRDAAFLNQPVSELWESEQNYILNRPRAFAIELPKAATDIATLTTVTSITYYDGSNTLQTLDPCTYSLISSDNLNPLIYPVYPNFWPMTYVRPDAATVLYTSGGLAPNSPILLGMLQTVAHWYANRESVILQAGVSPQTVPMLAKDLWWPYRVFEL
jgi:hypothetical protein